MTDKNRGNSCRLVTKCGTIATAQGTAFRTTYSRLAPSTSSAWTVNPRWPDSRRWQEVKVGLAFFVRSHEECPFVLQWWCHDPQREKLFALPSKLVEILPILSDQMSHRHHSQRQSIFPLKGEIELPNYRKDEILWREGREEWKGRWDAQLERPLARDFVANRRSSISLLRVAFSLYSNIKCLLLKYKLSYYNGQLLC